MSIALNTARAQAQQSSTLTKTMEDANGFLSTSRTQMNPNESGEATAKMSLTEYGNNDGGESQAFQDEAKMQKV